MQIPSFTNDVSVGTARMPRADVGGAGVVGDALARAGAAVSEEGQAFYARYQDARRQADASNIVAGISKQLNDAQFRWSKTPDSQAAFDGFNAEAETLKKTTLDGIKDPQVGSYVTGQFDREAITRGEETRRTAFGLESSARRGDLITNLSQTAASAATAGTPELRGQMLARGIASIHGAVAAGWVTPEMGAEHILKFQSDVDEAGVQRMLNGVLDRNDPDAAYRLARDVEDPRKFPGLLPEKREILSRQVENTGDRINARAAAADARADILAQRNLTRAQAYNAAQLVVAARAGKLDEKTLPELVRTQQLSETGYAAVVAALDREEKGRDDPFAAGNLRAAVESGHADADDINGAFSAGLISTTTHSAMMEKWGERQHQKDDQVERGAFNTLKTALSGGAIEQGIADRIFGSGAARATQAWGQAQGEWNRRVLVGKEDPMAVLSDLAPKYSDTVSRPTWLPTPKFGGVSDSKALDSVALRTLQARERGEIDAATYQGELQVLNNYRAFYTEKAIREAASIAIPFAKPGGKPRMEKAAP